MPVLTIVLSLALLAAIAWALAARRAATRREATLRADWETERAALRAEAGENEEHLTAILAGMEDGVLVADTTHTIRLANPSLQRLFALKGAPAGQTILGALRLPQLESMVREAITSGHSLQEEIAVPLTPGQPPVHLIVSAAPFRSAETILGAIVVFRDVSRLRKLEELRREFVANVSHELRTPLSIFHGHLENLLGQTEFPANELLPILAVMRRHSLRLNALVEDLLTLTRLESRRDPLRREPLALPDFFRDLTADWQSKAESRSVRLVADVGEDLPPLLADPHRLRQVFDNLLGNALNYTPAGGAVTLSARAEPHALELRVTDTGAGIPPADLPHIFERFYRADKARSRELGGTGLGLSIVKHIVLAHGGQVTAMSTCGKGTTVLVTLPKEATPAA